jgi:hypothetical protein
LTDKAVCDFGSVPFRVPEKIPCIRLLKQAVGAGGGKSPRARLDHFAGAGEPC